MHTLRICPDSNLVIRLVAAPSDQIVLELFENWISKEVEIVAPSLLYYEVTNALYRYRKMGLMSIESVRTALRATLLLPIRLYTEINLHEPAMELAERYALPAAYDAHYLALAEHFDAEFWTLDKKLVQAVGKGFPWVYLVE